MASQICRPSMTSCRGVAPGSCKAPANIFLRQVYRKQRISHSLLTGYRWDSSSGSKHALRPLHVVNSGEERQLKQQTPQQTHNFPDNKHLRILKLVFPVVLPVILLRVAPAIATTLSVTAAGNTAAKGFRVPELLASAWTGLMAGCLHTLTGPDHLAALAPLSIGRTKMEGAVVGALWGCGHDAGQIIFGLLFLLLKDKLHIDLLRTWSARVVGVTLLAIGALGIKEAQEAPVPCLAGEGCEAEYEAPRGKKPFGFTTFGTGVVHGLQPDALLVILPALALPSRLAGVAFLLMFLVGTVVAMASYTAFVGSCSEALQKKVPWMTQRLSLGSSLIAILVGLSILVGEVFGINLF